MNFAGYFVKELAMAAKNTEVRVKMDQNKLRKWNNLLIHRGLKKMYISGGTTAINRQIDQTNR
jgi:hypothetical protein